MSGQTALMYSVLNGLEESVRQLLSAGADTSIGEREGHTPLHGAGFQGRAAIAQLLIDHGLDPNERHADGYTPLHRACWGQSIMHTNTVKVLLDAGVPPDQEAHGHKCIEMTKFEQTRSLIHQFTWKDRPLAINVQDRNTLCPDWAASGECDANPNYMKEFCPVSCGVGKDKDEL